MKHKQSLAKQNNLFMKFHFDIKLSLRP